MAEIWELYDKDRNPTGRLLERGEPVPEGFYHLIVDIMTVNGRGEILVTKRHPSKKGGLKWETTGGAVVKGEENRPAAVRELFEETGIRKTESDLLFIGTYIGSSSITDFYITRGDYELSELMLQEIEVIDAKWVTLNEYEKMLENGEFISINSRLYQNYKDEILSFINEATEGKS